MDIKKFKKSIPLYIMLILPIAYIIIFNYAPMYGVIIAFKEYTAADGIIGSPWVGFDHFIRFFKNYNFWMLIRNTVAISVYSLIAGFICNIVFALMLNYARCKPFQKIVQTVSYAPNFISTVVIIGILFRIMDRTGPVNNIIAMLGMERINFIGKEEYYRHMFVWSGIWQGTGFGSIIYLGVLASIDQELYEAAKIDGANVLHRMWYIDVPSIMPTAILMFILSVGGILGVSFEKSLLMQNSQNLAVSEVLSTYTYKVGMASSFPEMSYASAIGLVTSIVGLILMWITNKISDKVANISMW